MVCASMKLPLQQSVVKDGVVGSEDEDDVEPSFGKELAAVVLDYVATFGQRFFQLIWKRMGEGMSVQKLPQHTRFDSLGRN